MRGLALLRRLQFALWCTGLLLCALCAGAYLQARFYQSMENRRLEEALHSGGLRDPARPPSPLPRPAGSLVGRLEIPRLRLSAVVLEGSDERTLRLGAGRIPETAAPGQAGNLVIGGHRDTFFRPLRAIHGGDRISLVTPGGAYRYIVEWTAVVNPSDRETLRPTPDRSLTLVTCYPFRYLGPAPQRFIVRARQVAPDATKTVSF